MKRDPTLKKRHKLALLALVLQAGVYPSVVIPCGMTYGVYCLIKGPTMRDRGSQPARAKRCRLARHR